jgi:amidase
VLASTGVKTRGQKKRVNPAPIGANTTLAAVAGYPHLTMPTGEGQELPVGLSFIGTVWFEPLLLACGYAFEQRRTTVRPPAYRTTLDRS